MWLALCLSITAAVVPAPGLSGSAAAGALAPACSGDRRAAGGLGFAGLAGRVAPTRTGCKVCCQDGDPECDGDGSANGVCRFLIDACIDGAAEAIAADPVLGAHVGRSHRHPSLVALEEAVEAMLPVAAPTCSAPVPVTIVRRPGRSGRMSLRLSTSAATGRRVRSRLVLVCRRTPCGGRWTRAVPTPRAANGLPAPGTSWTPQDTALLAAADARIEQLRRRPVTLRLTDAVGRPRVGVPVEVWQLSQSFPIGTAVTHFRGIEDDHRYLGLVDRNFNAMVTENSLKWEETEPSEGRLDYDDAERWIAWAARRGMTVKGTALVWGAPQGRPGWLRRQSPTAVRAAIERRITDVLSRFRGRIRVWDAVNEPILAPQFESALGPGYIADVFRQARAVDPDVTLVLNEVFPGTSRTEIMASIETFKMLVRERLFAVGVRPDAIGFQGHGAPRPLEWVQASLDSLAELGLPIHVTEFDGFPLTDVAEQADWYEGFLRIAFAHPAVTWISLWGFDDTHHWLGGTVIPLAPGIIGSGMYDIDYRPKPAAAAVASLLHGRWRTHERGITATDGSFRFSGFPGNYEARLGRERIRFRLDADAAEALTVEHRERGRS